MAKRLRSLKTTPELSEEALTQLERDIFVGFYSVRKLIEAVPKITDETKTCRVELSWFPSRASVSWRKQLPIGRAVRL